MPVTILHSMRLSSEEKRRIGDALAHIFLDCGLSQTEAMVDFEQKESARIASEEHPRSAHAPALPPMISPEFKSRARRTKAELRALEHQLIEALKSNQTLSSLQARRLLGLTNCDWAPATLRRLFQDLEHRGLVVQQGLKRGTSYAWVGHGETTH